MAFTSVWKLTLRSKRCCYCWSCRYSSSWPRAEVERFLGLSERLLRWSRFRTEQGKCPFARSLLLSNNNNNDKYPMPSPLLIQLLKSAIRQRFSYASLSSIVRCYFVPCQQDNEGHRRPVGRVWSTTNRWTAVVIVNANGHNRFVVTFVPWLVRRVAASYPTAN